MKKIKEEILLEELFISEQSGDKKTEDFLEHKKAIRENKKLFRSGVDITNIDVRNIDRKINGLVSLLIVNGAKIHESIVIPDNVKVEIREELKESIKNEIDINILTKKLKNLYEMDNKNFNNELLNNIDNNVKKVLGCDTSIDLINMIENRFFKSEKEKQELQKEKQELQKEKQELQKEIKREIKKLSIVYNVKKIREETLDSIQKDKPIESDIKTSLVQIESVLKNMQRIRSENDVINGDFPSTPKI